MRLEWKLLIDDEVESVAWENGQVVGYDDVATLAELMSQDPPEEVEIYWGWFSAPASLETAEKAWGTIRHAIKLLGAQIITQPDPPFEPPFEDGVVY